MIYLTSDWHFGHEKEFLWGPRNFTGPEQNAEEIIKRYNEIVTDEDDVYCLGDLMLKDTEFGMNCVKQLKGKIHIIRGNHDSDTRIELYKTLPNVVEICEAKTLKVGKQHYFLCHYPTMTANYDDKPYHNHIINLYGHTHQQTNFYNNNPFMYHVGVDSHDCYPVSIEQINEDIHDKVNELYKEKVQREKDLKDYYKNGLGYFEQHPACGLEILD